MVDRQIDKCNFKNLHELQRDANLNNSSQLMVKENIIYNYSVTSVSSGQERPGSTVKSTGINLSPGPLFIQVLPYLHTRT